MYYTVVIIVNARVATYIATNHVKSNVALCVCVCVFFRSQNRYIKQIWVDEECRVIEIFGSSKQKVRRFIQESKVNLPQSAFRILKGDPFVLMSADTSAATANAE